MCRRIVPLILAAMLVVTCAGAARSADFYELRDGIPNSQYFLRQNSVGNQYLFFIGNSVLAGAGLQTPDLRYSLRMTEAIRKQIPDASVV